MNWVTVNSKGQITLPIRFRKRLNLKTGTKICIIEEGKQIILKPLTSKYFEEMAGILNSKGKLTKALIKEKAREKTIEEKKILKN